MEPGASRGGSVGSVGPESEFSSERTIVILSYVSPFLLVLSRLLRLLRSQRHSSAYVLVDHPCRCNLFLNVRSTPNRRNIIASYTIGLLRLQSKPYKIRP